MLPGAAATDSACAPATPRASPLSSCRPAARRFLPRFVTGVSAPRSTACGRCRGGGGTATRTMVSALSPAAEAALRWAEVWLPWCSGLERRGREALPLGAFREPRREGGWARRECGWQLWESPASPGPSSSVVGHGRPGGPRSPGNSSKFGS